MRLICDGHSKTPIEFYYLETASLPLKSILSSRRIMYLHHILGRNDGELIKRVFNAQRDNTTPGDFVDLVKGDLLNIGEIFDEEKIKLQTKNQFKTHIKNKIKSKTFKDLKSQQQEHSKVRSITYTKFEIQSYMTSSLFSNEMVRVLFNMRCSMTKGIKSNFSSIFRNDIGCKMKCNQTGAIDNQEHLLSCPILLSNLKSDQISSVNYDNIFGSLEEQRKVVNVLIQLPEIRNKILEVILPVGQINGPDSTIN